MCVYIIPEDDINRNKETILLQDVSRIETIEEDYVKLRFRFESGEFKDQNFNNSDERLIAYNSIDLNCLNGGGAISTQYTFETVSKNLLSSNVVAATTTSMTYANGVIKTIDEPDDATLIVTLSGITPWGIDLVKTVVFTGDNLPLITYT